MEEKKGKDVITLLDNDIVTVTKMGHIVELQYMEKSNHRCNILKLDKDHFVDRFGEIKEYNHTEHRGQSENSLRQTFKRLRYLINNNFNGSGNELFVTLTYAKNMKDVKQLYDDVRKFIMRFKYRFKDKTTIDYINVVEPQERGAWHCHILFRFNDLKNIYIPNEDLKKMWGQGFVKVNKIENVDNIGAYLTAYLTDLEIEANEGECVSNDVVQAVIHEKRDIVQKDVRGKKKSFVKGGRIHLYPPGLNIYRSSRGIRSPERVKMQYKDIKKVVGSAKPHYFKTYNIKSDEFKNVISFIQYNLKR